MHVLAAPKKQTNVQPAFNLLQSSKHTICFVQVLICLFQWGFNKTWSYPLGIGALMCSGAVTSVMCQLTIVLKMCL